MLPVAKAAVRAVGMPPVASTVARACAAAVGTPRLPAIASATATEQKGGTKVDWVGDAEEHAVATASWRKRSGHLRLPAPVATARHSLFAPAFSPCAWAPIKPANSTRHAVRAAWVFMVDRWGRSGGQGGKRPGWVILEENKRAGE